MKKNSEYIGEIIGILMIFIFGLMCFLTSCNKRIVDEYTYVNDPGSMTSYSVEYVYNNRQLDSILCSNKSIELIHSNWLQSSYVDYETNEYYTEYFFYDIDSTGNVHNIYKVRTINDSTYKYTHTIFNK